MKCTVCDSSNVTFVSNYQSYKDYNTKIFDCFDCKSRFVPHDLTAHEMLHSNPSSYHSHLVTEHCVLDYIRENNIKGLERYLERREANKFVIEHINQLSSTVNILEIGCSRGYMAAYFLVTGHNVLGVDISETAVVGAKQSFGDHFCGVEDSRVYENYPYDVIYHVGTIGCVNSPAKFTRDLIELLKPGGFLIFNAPNRNFCEASGSLWLSTPPPDLVTLFNPNYWLKSFNDIAEANIEIINSEGLASGFLHLSARNENRNKYKMLDSKAIYPMSLIEKIKRTISAFYYSISAVKLPTEYGIHVLLRKKH